MLDGYSTNATVAKIRAIHGNMFKCENYHEMLSRRSVAEEAEYLKKAPRFKEALQDVDPSTIHRGLLESLVKKANVDLYKKLCDFQGIDKVEFFKYPFYKRELEQILNLINDMNSDLDNRFIGDLPGYVLKYSNLDMLALSKAENFQELLKILVKSKRYRVLNTVEVSDDGKVDLSECELKLRTYYYQSLLDCVEKGLTAEDAAELKKLILTEVDIINIINAYRLKAFFGYSSEQIKQTMLPFTRIGKNRINHIYESETADEMISRLEKTIYFRNFKGDFVHIENKVNAYIFQIMRSTVARSISAPVVLYAFIRLCDIEVNNIIHIIEGVRYDINKAEIEGKMIIC